MKERPIIFSGSMVRAIEEGRKTNTRRVIDADVSGPNNPGRHYDFRSKRTGKWIGAFDAGGTKQFNITCPYGQPGDRLWVRETFAIFSVDNCQAYISLEITKVRVERVQEISEENAYAEGVTDSWPLSNLPYLSGHGGRAVLNNFAHLWNSINLKREGGKYSWQKNPWVWVLEFKRVEAVA